jgi:hypothetical protein
MKRGFEAIKIFGEAAWCLFTFRPYTIYPRFFEICCGVVAWIAVILIIYAIIK